MRRQPSKRLRFDVMTRDGFACVYCGRKAPDVELVIDHKIPVAADGDTTIDNLVTSCKECNEGKSDAIVGIPCSVCGKDAAVYVYLYKVYEHGYVFFEQDYTCKFLCMDHVLQNERGANFSCEPRPPMHKGGPLPIDYLSDGSPDGSWLPTFDDCWAEYIADTERRVAAITPLSEVLVHTFRPFTNKHCATGETVYVPIHLAIKDTTR